ncbi:MAG TPA: TonB-dependent receptor [Sphingomicrobium sp.]|nr:TonB-dependent receptor [Sphingomicrobium sp.]
MAFPITLLRSASPLAVALCMSSPLLAQPADRAAAGSAVALSDSIATGGPASDIVVTGRRTRSDDVLGDVSVLGGADLAASIRPTLGETLASQAGVSTSGSGPNVARPVLRGLSGDRIRILTDGIGSLDVSSSSSDHAVAINPLTADSIEVLHGPAALLYGSSAIGGVVNVVDARIPRRVPADTVSAQGILGYATAANERLANGEVNVALGGNIVAHGDLNWTRNGNLRTGGHILARPLRRQAAVSPDADIRALAELKGDLPNSDGRSFEGAGALAYVDGGFNLGASISRHTAFYGVPVRYSLDPAVEAERTHIDVHQTRYDARAEIPLSGAFKQVRLRGGYSNYNHAEVADDGEIGSRIFSKGGEGRIDLAQRDHEHWGGTSGGQYVDIRQHIEGDEQFLPPTRQRTIGLFTLQHGDLGKVRIEGGARFERNMLDADASSVVGNPDLERRFSTLSLSAGASYAVTPQWKIGLNVARSQRAPSTEELFANGPHGGNASFQIGNPDLGTERSLGFEASVKHKSRAIDASFIFYGTRFANYLYQVPTGAVIDELPVYQAREGRASYVGFEAQAEARLGRTAGIEWGAEFVGDATRATIRNVGPAPLIPPLRLQGAVTGRRGSLGGRLEIERNWAQNRTADFETRTPGFTLVNASLDWQPLAEKPELSLSLAANNIFDAESRRHSSLLKDYAPLAGRDVRLTAHFRY